MISKSPYWEELADQYQRETLISCDDFHYGPLAAGDNILKLLPHDLAALNCLEIACGGAQNSIFLAKHGAQCTALDASRAQISHAEKLALENKVEISFLLMSMEELPGKLPHFDLIHSAYGFNFAVDFNRLIDSASNLLKKNGVLLFSLPHPLFSGEFLEIDNTEGLFLENYFAISPDLRFDVDDKETARSDFYSPTEISVALERNSMRIEAIREPGLCENPPYTSNAWEEYREQLQRFPATLIIKAIKNK
ncbi:MAG: class I SAM-dependent methyltransferase [Victivallaceae bacterium]